jgi:two-component system alkaline phosphatase synthesis response regulator PhoP
MTTSNPQPPDILLVDDHEQNLELLEAYLESLSGTVRMARDGAEALAMVQQRKPELILLDVMMPKLSGFQVCRKLKDDPATKGIKIIMVTALNEESDQARAVDSGADDFLSKPVNKVELINRVRMHLGR